VTVCVFLRKNPPPTEWSDGVSSAIRAQRLNPTIADPCAYKAGCEYGVEFFPVIIKYYIHFRKAGRDIRRIGSVINDAVECKIKFGLAVVR
jgi:hypothetical protein